MRVSTVIPVYNRQDLVKEAIRSAQAQQIEGHEIVVIDNCSTDATWSVVQEFARNDSRIRCLRNERNVGPVRNWRLGLEAARGEYCHLLFSDDVIAPNFVDATISQFDSRTAFVLAGHQTMDAFGTRDPSRFQSQGEYSREEFVEAAIFLNPRKIQCITPLVAMFRRSDVLASLIDEIPNPFGIDFAAHGAGPDQLIFLLTAIRYPIVKCVNEYLATMHAHAGSITIESRDLSVPREWTRWYFVRKFWPEAQERFRSMVWLKSKRAIQFKPVFDAVDQELGGRVRLAKAFEYGLRRVFGMPEVPKPESIGNFGGSH
jgi:glycosyltransferase involved in cell wall biosynthesis